MFKFRSLPLVIFQIAAIAIGCNNKDEKQTVPDVSQSTVSKDPKVAKLKLPAGFNADHLYGPSENEEGSWVAMTFDDKGRLIASDQYGALYRMTVPPVGDTVTKIKIEKNQIILWSKKNYTVQ